jgi:hypothetical protein
MADAFGTGLGETAVLPKSPVPEGNRYPWFESVDIND